MILKKVFSLNKKKTNNEKEKLLTHLQELQKLEARLWGVKVKHLSNGEEEVLEDANHLIHMISHNKYEQLKTLLEKKAVKDFLNDLRNLKNDFLYLKQEIKKKDKLKNLITQYTLKLVDKKTFSKMEEIFILEKQLYDVIEKQENEIENLYKHLTHIKINIKGNEAKIFLGSLTKIRTVLAGHMDHHTLWEDNRQGFSNTSNILNSLIKAVKEDI